MEPRAPQLPATPEEPYDAAAPAVSLGKTPATAARMGAPVVALSEDSTLLDAMSSAALDHAAVIVSPSADRFIDQLVATGAELALIDAAASPPGLAEFLVSLHRQFPQLQLLLVGPGNAQHQVAAQIADGTVFRFVHKPASAARLKLFIEAALRQRQARITEEILSTPFSKPQALIAPQSPSGRPRWMISSLIAGLLMAVAAALFWYFSSSSHPPDTQTDASLPGEASAPVVHALVPQNASIATALAQQKEAEQEAIDRAAAQRAESDRIAADEQTRVDATVEQARRASAAAAQARTQQIHSYVQLALSRIASGALIEPNDDSARTYVSSAVRLAPDDESVRAVAASLGEALTASFHKALAAGDRAAAERWLKASRSYPAVEATVDQMSLQLGSFEVAQAAQAVADQAIANADISPPTQAPAAPAPAPVPAAVPVPGAVVTPIAQIMPESSLHRLIFAPPAYPQEAAARGETGTVELDFTVTPKGAVADIKVTASNPAGVFEDAAIAALRRDRYQPVERDGVAVSQRAHIRMRFAL